MAQESWQAALTKSVATQIRRWRLQRGLSAQQLSDRCGELGHAIPRPVLSNIETGRRESITLAELLIIAAALDVPPLVLISPPIDEEAIEILPDQRVVLWQVVGWFMGVGPPTAESTTGRNPIVQMVLSQLSRTAIGVTPDGTAVEGLGESIAKVQALLVYIRSDLVQTMRDRGEEPPPLPPELRAQLAQDM